MAESSRQNQLEQIAAALQRSINSLNAKEDPHCAIVETLRAAAEALSSLTVIGLGYVCYSNEKNTLRLKAFVRDGNEVDISGTVLDQDWPVYHPSMIIPWRRIQSENFIWGLTSDPSVLIPEVRGFHEADGTKSVAYQALRRGENVIGWIAFSFASTQSPSHEQVNVIQTMAGLVSLAVEMERIAQKSQEFALAREREIFAQKRADELMKANHALQTTIEALSEIKDHTQIIPRVLEIIAHTFNSKSCAAFENTPSGDVFLRYWCKDGKTLSPEELLKTDSEKYALVHMLAKGFQVPDDYLGGHSSKIIGPVILNHEKGTSVAEFDKFAMEVGWEIELNIGVASKGLRAFTLCIYRSVHEPFTEEEIGLGEALAKQLGLAMATYKLIEETNRAALDREQKRLALARSEELERASLALQETIDEVAKLPTLETFIPHALLIVSKAFGVKSAGYFEHPGERIYLRFWLHNDTIYGPQDLPSLNSTNLSVLSQLAAGFTVPPDHLGVDFRLRNKPGIINHLTATASPALHAFAASMGWDWELNVPLMVNGKAEGAVTLFRPANHPFTEADYTLAGSLGKQIALCMQIALLAERERTVTVQNERQEASQQRIKAIIGERERIAREIHDTLAQGFTAILINLKTLRKRFSFPQDVIETLDTLQHLAQDNLIEARRSLTALRPRSLEHNDLINALRQLINSVERALDTKVELVADAPLPFVPESVENELLRIAQEALQNGLRYAGGTRITISVHQARENGINLVVEDDGKGFDPQVSSKGYGLKGMQERAERIGAALTIIAEPGYGTKVIVLWDPSHTI